MKIILHKSFEKKYRKLPEQIKRKFKERRNIFLTNPFHSVLKNHTLTGKYLGYRSINITGDVRAVYQPLGTDTALFVIIDTHSNLFK